MIRKWDLWKGDIVNAIIHHVQILDLLDLLSVYLVLCSAVAAANIELLHFAVWTESTQILGGLAVTVEQSSHTVPLVLLSSPVLLVPS